MKKRLSTVVLFTLIILTAVALQRTDVPSAATIGTSGETQSSISN